jgi:hypothetical protein
MGCGPSSVLAVMCFHFGLPPFGAGYVGVDVFFVISGYFHREMKVYTHSRISERDL